jgi:Domain of unknown function (DUF4331)
MSSHREAPEISKDPVADNTDVYAFVSTNPAESGTVTIITNYIPLEGPDGGPNFYEFGDDVLYQIYVDNDGDALPEITYQFQFQTIVQNPNTFLYNTGPIGSLKDPNWNRRQFYSVTKVVDNGGGSHETVLATGLASPPVNVGVRSTPNYETNLGRPAVHHLASGETVFAGQRLEGFYVDLGSVFDLLALRPFQHLHLIPLPDVSGVDATKNVNVHTIAIQVPISQLTRDGSTPTEPTDPRAVIGVWASASRQKVTIRGKNANTQEAGPWVQVSRLGNPLFNEVIVPMGKKDLWNSLSPEDDAQFLQFVQHPEVARLLPVLYPGVFPNLATLNSSDAARADLVAILLTGIPKGIVSPTFSTFTGPTFADMLRLNMAIPPTPVASAKLNGVLAGDLAGFPNGRRVFDDVATIEIRAIAGVTYPLVVPSFTPDGAAGLVSDFSTSQLGLGPGQVPGSDRYIDHFPYLGVPRDGFDTPSM